MRFYVFVCPFCAYFVLISFACLCDLSRFIRETSAFMHVFAAPVASPAPPNPSIKEAAFGRLHKGGPAAFGRRPPFVDSLMDGCVGAGEAADAAETRMDAYEKCACIHIMRKICDPHGGQGITAYPYINGYIP